MALFRFGKATDGILVGDAESGVVRRQARKHPYVGRQDFDAPRGCVQTGDVRLPLAAAALGRVVEPSGTAWPYRYMSSISTGMPQSCAPTWSCSRPRFARYLSTICPH